jgi:hypothetical protein
MRGLALLKGETVEIEEAKALWEEAITTNLSMCLLEWKRVRLKLHGYPLIAYR